MHTKDKHILIRVEAIQGEHLVIRALIAALIVCVGLYLYFVGLSIMNVIANREASVESQRLQSTVGTLEQEYFKLAQEVTPEKGASLGLTATTQSVYVRRANGMATNVSKGDI